MYVSRKPKTTSYEYGVKYQSEQAEKYRNRKNNHWKYRIELAHDLVENYVLHRHQGKANKDITIVDVGCSIGTFAIEFAKLGFNTYGIDFDSSALEIAKQLSREEKVDPQFVCGDIASWDVDFPPIDIAICFDIFEHLHDDELGSLLVSIRKQLSEKGAIVFHTYPTQYDYIFFKKSYLGYPLILMKNISQSNFERIVKSYAYVIDALLLLCKGMTYKDMLTSSGDCNPMNRDRLTNILKRAGYESVLIEACNLYDKKQSLQRRFRRQPITFRNLYGVAEPSRS